MNRRSFVERHLGGEVGGTSEAVDAETPTRLQFRATERSITDDPGAQERRGLFIAENMRDWVGVALIDDGLLGISAVGVPSGETGLDAEVLPSGQTLATRPAGPA